MNNGQGDKALHAPVLDSSTLEGPTNRAKLLRAWIELSAWLAGFTKRYGWSLFGLSDVGLGYHFPSIPLLATELVDHLKIRTSVKIDSVRELYQSAIGAHPEQRQCPEIRSDQIANQRPSAPWGSSRDLKTEEGTSR